MDRRQTQRYLLKHFVVYFTRDNALGWIGLSGTRLATLIDASRLGLQVLSPEWVQPGNKYRCEIKGPEAEQGIGFRATVVWCKPATTDRRLFRAAFRVEEIDPAKLDHLQGIFVRHGSASGPGAATTAHAAGAPAAPSRPPSSSSHPTRRETTAVARKATRSTEMDDAPTSEGARPVRTTRRPTRLDLRAPDKAGDAPARSSGSHRALKSGDEKPVPHTTPRPARTPRAPTRMEVPPKTATPADRPPLDEGERDPQEMMLSWLRYQRSIFAAQGPTGRRKGGAAEEPHRTPKPPAPPAPPRPRKPPHP